MKRVCLVLVLFISLPLLAVDVSVETAVNSQYLWRGMVLNDKPVFQPGVTFSGGGLELNIWGNMDLTDDYDHEFEFYEVDYTLSYYWEQDGMEWVLGVISYTYPNTDWTSTMEAYAGCTWTDVTFSPSVTLYYDFDEVEGFYLEVGGSHEFDSGLSVGLSFGYASEDYVDAYFAVDGDADAAFTHYALSLDYPVALKYGELNLNLTYGSLVDSSIHSPGFEGEDENLVLGVTWSMEF